MPRREALRTLGATMAIGLLRLVRPSPAGAAVGRTSTCPAACDGMPAKYKDCCVPIPKGGFHRHGCINTEYSECCIGPSPMGPDRMSWECPKGKCGSDGSYANKCRREGCSADEQACGTACCKMDRQFCASFKNGMCCNAGENGCLAIGTFGVASTIGTCCKPGTKCCATQGKATCCDANQACVSGACRCSSTTTQCGSDCCTKSEVCLVGRTSDGQVSRKCCAKGKVNCGGECCDGSLCCDLAARKMCCPPGQFCATIAGAPGNKNCCPSARIAVMKSGQPVCCGEGLVATPDNGCCPPGKPDCCGRGSAELSALCNSKQICVSGECRSI